MSAVLAGLAAPVVGAPMAGGPSTVALAAAVSGAGGLGFLAGANLAVDALAGRVRELRDVLGERPFGVNLFLPTAEPPLLDLAAHLAALDRWAARYDVRRGAATWDDDAWRAKVDVLLADPVPVVGFHFGCPPRDVVDALHGVGSEVWTTVTSRAEARTATAGGVDALVVQGREAGGHRGTHGNDAGAVDPDDEPGLLALLRLVSSVTELPLVAAGGLVHGADVAAVLVAGASAAQCGSAFLGCPEAGTSSVHRAAAAADRPTATTRAFSGRPARGVRNALLDELTDRAPAAYPHLNRASGPVRAAAAQREDDSAVALWAGQTHHLARVLPAAEVVALLVAEARDALSAATSRLR
ncbi:nitronate monooxygenase [Rhodococcus aerolatus]